MKPYLYELNFDGAVLGRGFWLYVWEISTPGGATLYYVGRTGDSSSSNAQSPFNRMGQHLGFNKKSNVLRRRLQSFGIDAEGCKFRLVACGPLLQEASTREEHRERRDQIAAMEKALAEAMTTAGYKVMNTVACRASFDPEAFTLVMSSFGQHFTKLGKRPLSGGLKGKT